MTWLTQDRSRLDAFRRGDREVLAQVYQHYAAVVVDVLRLGFSFQSGGNSYRFHGYATPFALDDALQETFARAFSPSGRQGFDGLRPYRNYLLSIARNLTIDRMRRSKHEPRLFSQVDEQDQHVPATPAADSPEHEAMLQQLRQLIAAFKQDLSDQDRALFELRFERGEPRAAVSAQLGLSAMQVRTREKKLRSRILARLDTGGWSGAGDVEAVLVLIALCAAAASRTIGHAL